MFFFPGYCKMKHKSAGSASHSAVHPREEKRDKNRERRDNNAESWTHTKLQSSWPHSPPSCTLIQSETGGESLSSNRVHVGSSLVPPVLLGGGGPVGRRDVEDWADSQEEAPEDGPQLRDQVELHHFTQVGVVAGSMGLELKKRRNMLIRHWQLNQTTAEWSKT